MEKKIDEGGNLSPSEMEEERAWRELIDWCQEVADHVLVAESFLLAVQLANKLSHGGMPERMIESAWKIARKLEERVRTLRTS